MGKLLGDVMERIGEDLTTNISGAVLETVETLFGEKMYMVDAKDRKEGFSSLAVNVVLTQGSKNARLRLVFDCSLIETLALTVYPKTALEDGSVLEDAAAEVANIICNKIKAFINAKGFSIEMGFPEVDNSPLPANPDEGVVCLNFSTYKNRLAVKKILHVNME